MPNDAKLGLIVGIVLVIVVAVLFFHSQGAPPAMPAAVEVQTATPPSPAAVAAPEATLSRPGREAKGQVTSMSKD